MLCKCGCGKQVTKGRTFLSGHNNRKPIVKRTCPVCNQEFIVKGSYPTKKCCSPKCYGITRRVERITRICEICKKSFNVTLKETKLSYRKARFCSNTCKGIFYSRNPDYTGVAKLAKKGVAPPNLALFIEGGKKSRFNGDIRNKIIGAKGRQNQKFPYRDTSIEIKIRKELDNININYLVNRCIPNHFDIGTIDILLPDYKIAIFADGCYWHSCERCIRLKDINRDRIKWDNMITTKVKEAGWLPLRFWQHDIDNNLAICIDQIREAINHQSLFA